MSETFSEFKTQFYKKVNDLSILDCGEINLLKVILDGLKVNYKNRGIKNREIFRNNFINGISLFARRVKYRRQIKEAKQV